MVKLTDMFRSSKPQAVDPLPAGKPAPAENQPSGTVEDEEPLFDPEVKGQDARRLAELMAEEAGRKWRRQAEANGEVQKEVGGPKGLEPTRFGDWEKAGRCFDF